MIAIKDRNNPLLFAILARSPKRRLGTVGFGHGQPGDRHTEDHGISLWARRALGPTR